MGDLISHIVQFTQFIRVQHSTVVLHNGYTYSKNNPISGGRTRYRCSSFKTFNCKAYLHVDEQNVIVKRNVVHDHDPPNLVQLASYITLVSGTKLLIIGEYSYSVRGRIRDQGFRFKCSSYLSKGCKAFAHVTKDDVIVKANTLHNHPPSRYKRMSCGKFFKLS